jgi:hypothetical protein
MRMDESLNLILNLPMQMIIQSVLKRIVGAAQRSEAQAHPIAL